jgi:transcriptional regulator with GAF, ATPase, and Fis domain
MLPKRFGLREFLDALKNSLIQRALQNVNEAQAQAARTLGLSRGDVFYNLGKDKVRSRV